MRRSTKFAAALTAGILSLALTACGGSSDDNDSAKEPSGSSSAKSDIKVGLAYDIGGRGDQSFNDMAAAGGPVASRGFVAPLKDELLSQPVIFQHRVEVVAPKTHWPLTYLLPEVAVARGWERQTDEARNKIFYGREPLTSAAYRAFLDRNAVGYVAFPTHASLDYGSTREAALIRAGLPYLEQVWSNADWRLYADAYPAPIVERVPGPSTGQPPEVLAADDTGFTFDVFAPGRYLVRMTWSPYLTASGAKVARAPYDHVYVTVPGAGHYRLRAVWGWP